MRSHSIMHPTESAFHDKWLIVAIFGIAILGLLMMTSASIVISDQYLHKPFYYLYKQLIFLVLGIIVGSLIIQIEIIQWKKFGGYLLPGMLLLLALVLIPGIGHSVNGSTRWIGYGPFSFQVSELTKFVVVVYMAGYLIRRHVEIRYQLSGFLKP